MQFNFRHQSQPLLELRPERTHIAVNVAAPAHLIEPDNTSATNTQQPVDSWAGTIQTWLNHITRHGIRRDAGRSCVGRYSLETCSNAQCASASNTRHRNSWRITRYHIRAISNCFGMRQTFIAYASHVMTATRSG